MVAPKIHPPPNVKSRPHASTGEPNAQGPRLLSVARPLPDHWHPVGAPLSHTRDQAATSKSSSVITGPESWPFADTSRSTNSMIAIGEASDARMPALMMRV